MKNIAVIGVGQLGSRHLQSLKSIQVPSKIWVVDNSETSLAVAKERYDSLPDNKNIISVSYIHTTEDIPNMLDLVIVATNSAARANVIIDICEKSSVKYWILEKVLFQSVDDYIKMETLIEEKKIKAWVNCPRRLYAVYHTVKKMIEKEKVEEVIVEGRNLGLGCNSIHFIDIIAWLITETNYTVSSESLDKKILDSKRAGFKEFTGELVVRFASGTKMTILDNDDWSGLSVTIKTPQKKIQINESEKRLTVYDVSVNDNAIDEEFLVPFQSQLTSIIANDIFVRGECELTPLDQSIKLHLPFITELIRFCNDSGLNTEICPIT